VKVFNLKDMKHSDRWNPLQENQEITDVQTTSDVIISNTQLHNSKGGGDEFWHRAEDNLLQAFQFYFLETFSSKTFKNEDLQRLTSESDIDLTLDNLKIDTLIKFLMK